MPRAKVILDLKSAARSHTAMGLNVLSSIAKQPKAPAAARVAAVGLLLERGWGKAPQAHTGENGEGDIRITIRHLIEHLDDQRLIAGPVIDNDDTD